MKKNNKGSVLITIILLVIIVGLIFYILNEKGVFSKEDTTSQKSSSKKIKEKEVKGEEKETSSEYEISGNSLEKFDLEFLKLENEKENKIYSPLSIKYALSMLNQGTSGKSKEQIERVIGRYTPKKYINSKNMSFANAFFVRDTYKNNIKDNFVSNLTNKLDADVIYDSFKSAKTVNSWISDKTLDLINDALSDSDIEDLNFALVNALAIDMDWEDKFLAHSETWGEYTHEKFSWISPSNVVEGSFEGIDNDISGMQIMTSVNKYDIVNELGEDNIRQTVGAELEKYLKKNPESYFMYNYSDVDSAVKGYLDNYIKELNENYKDLTKNTDYVFYVDDDVKAFGKDLKKYDGVTLEYVAIMPKNEKLDDYIEDMNAKDISDIINNLKELKLENFKDGVITYINGYIPKFKFEYDLDLMNDLKELGIEDIFDEKKANLKEMTDEDAYIGTAIHKANIEFTQDGIKAAAATMLGGLGAGCDFDYLYDVPTEEIDLIFDNPYMFLIIDKDTGEVWFAGTVYEPLSSSEETERLENMSEFWINKGPTVVTY